MSFLCRLAVASVMFAFIRSTYGVVPVPDQHAAHMPSYQAIDLMVIQITNDNHYVVRAITEDQHETKVKIPSKNTPSLSNYILKFRIVSQAPKVIIQVDSAAPFQFLVSAVAEMVAAKLTDFEVAANAERAKVRIPKNRPNDKQTEIKLEISAQGTYSIDGGKVYARSDVPDLAHLLRDRLPRPECCYVIIYADKLASVHDYLNAVLAIQQAAINDYWIAAEPTAFDKKKALEDRILELEKTRELLMKQERSYISTTPED